MRRKLKPIPEFTSEAEERRFGRATIGGLRRLEQGRGRAAAEPPAVHEVDLTAPGR
jgi:hypothetical protein